MDSSSPPAVNPPATPVNSVSNGTSFSYDHQELWGEFCNGNIGKKQSPIDILTSNVKSNSALTQLKFSNWDLCYDGEFKNMGYNVQFDLDPNTPDQAKITNHRGTYLLKQFHMHWGSQDGEGTEHLIDGKANEVEIHFVHIKEGGMEGEEDYHSVVGVLAEVDSNIEVSGPWAKLNVSAIQNFKDSTHVSQFCFNQLLPKNRGYYYYQGSLTTPPCSETVAWFLLKDRIKIPAAFLHNLRKVGGVDGQVLGYNFRRSQPVGDRIVAEHKTSC